MFNTSLFGNPITIPDNTDVVFVADLFIEDYVGGAELTTDALIQSSQFNIYKLHSKDLDLDLIQSNKNLYWIFGNFANLNFELIPAIVGNLQYSVLEYDFKYCKYRSTAKHKLAEGSDCNCHNEELGKYISAFYYGAKNMWWMSEKQLEHYIQLFPFLSEKNNVVLSSVFDESTLKALAVYRQTNLEKKGWIVLGSPSWIKGADNAKAYCESNNLDYEVVWGLDYAQTLEKLATAKGFVYLPNDKDTCPRMVIEAKLLGCELILNENVLHVNEDWFNADEETMWAYLYAARNRFWEGVKDDAFY